MENVKLFTVPLPENFLSGLAAYILGKDLDLLQLAGTTIILPTERACLALEREFISVIKDCSLVMPCIRPITRWNQLLINSAPVISPPQRHLSLSHLLREKTGYPWQECFSLATSLGQLLDQLQTEEIPLEKLETLVPDELSVHWQRSLDFLRILSHEWPSQLARLNLAEPLPTRTRAYEQQGEEWQKLPPQGLIIVAGVVGSVPSIARFLKTISALPTGEIIFAGLDLEMPEEQWQKLPPYHPQYGLKQTLERMEYQRENIQLLAPSLSKNWRSRLLNNLFDPQGLQNPSFTECFQENALESVSLAEADSLQEEARMIALMIREALNDSAHTIALVTPHRGLSDRVTAELKRWKIVPDDSYGESLFESSRGAFLTLTLNAACHPQNMTSVLSLLKHPLTLLGLPFFDCRKMTRRLEIHSIRPLSPFEKFDVQQIEDADISSFYKKFSQAMEPLLVKTTSLADWVKRHRIVLETLTNSSIKEEKSQLWEREEGKKIAELLQQLEKISLPHHDFTLKEYSGLLSLHLKKLRVTKVYGTHPRVLILGPLEARLLNFDVIILGAMNDIHWSELSQPDPWLSHEMKQKLGLPDERYGTGLRAADWIYLLHAKHVILTRAQREGGLTMLPSRWLMRLKAVVKSHRCSSLLEPTSPWKKWSHSLDRPRQTSLCSRPAPCPPVSLRPRTLSITEVQRWKDDPYALYAKKILRLTPLFPLEKEITAATFGIVVHQALEKYISTGIREQSRESLLEYGRQAFGLTLEHIIVKSLWWPRFIRLCDWFLEEEKRSGHPCASWTEVRGRLTIEAPAGPFTLIAKADRIDALKRADAEHNVLDIIDYKTGLLPSRKAVLRGDVVQLPLEAAITQYGSWENIPPSALGSLSLWHLKGGIPAGSVLRFEGIEDMAEKALSDLQGLVFLFDDEATPYEASSQNSNEYDPLTRRQEWSR